MKQLREEIAIKLVIEVTDYIGNLESGKMSDTIAQEIIYDVIGGKLISLLPLKIKELIEKATVECPECNGEGEVDLGEPEKNFCVPCQGSGSIIQPEGLVRLAENQEPPTCGYASLTAVRHSIKTECPMLKDNWRKIDESPE